MSNNITWAPIIPLIGGFPLGAEKALGKPPEFIASYTGFWGNDSHYVNYQNNTLGRNIPYINLTETPDHKQKVNIIVATPPCAGLSQLNTGQNEAVKGAGCQKNEWMYVTARDALERYDCDVYLCENAPALYTNKGKPVADKLFEIAKEFGYSLTLYKTSTQYHGIPQHRDRTFAIMWKSETAPIMNWYREPRTNFIDYINGMPKGLSQDDQIINPKIADEPYYKFLAHKFDMDARSVVLEHKVTTALIVVNRLGLAEEANAWFHKTGNKSGIKHSDRMLSKAKVGKGVWDGSVHVFDDVMNAVIGRNMCDTIHPTQDRSLSVRESLYMMGFPNDFEVIGGKKKVQHIAQNVPVCTAASMVKEAVKFINGDLVDSGLDYFRQNNHTRKYDTEPVEDLNSLEEFFALQANKVSFDI